MSTVSSSSDVISHRQTPASPETSFSGLEARRLIVQLENLNIPGRLGGKQPDFYALAKTIAGRLREKIDPSRPEAVGSITLQDIRVLGEEILETTITGRAPTWTFASGEVQTLSSTKLELLAALSKIEAWAIKTTGGAVSTKSAGNNGRDISSPLLPARPQATDPFAELRVSASPRKTLGGTRATTPTVQSAVIAKMERLITEPTPRKVSKNISDGSQPPPSAIGFNSTAKELRQADWRDAQLFDRPEVSRSRLPPVTLSKTNEPSISSVSASATVPAFSGATSITVPTPLPEIESVISAMKKLRGIAKEELGPTLFALRDLFLACKPFQALERNGDGNDLGTCKVKLEDLGKLVHTLRPETSQQISQKTFLIASLPMVIESVPLGTIRLPPNVLAKVTGLAEKIIGRLRRRAQ